MVGKSRLTLVAVGEGRGDEGSFAREVERGLSASPKRLSCRHFYDREGSRLFEAICGLPEYYLPRAEWEILRARAEEIAALPGEQPLLFELGSGSAAKTRLLIEALIRRHGGLRYAPVDISRDMLEQSARALVQKYPVLEVIGLAGEYGDGLRWLGAESGRPKLVTFLGSNIGNFERELAVDFLRQARRSLCGEDRVLVGVDLRKEPLTLQRAYDDSQGITARFNLNLLARVNRELGACFDLDAFEHRAVYREAPSRIEMSLVSRRAQTVRIGRLGRDFAFEQGEAIHTEDSHKYSPEEIDALARAAGFSLESQWFDSGRRFSLSLMAPVPSR